MKSLATGKSDKQFIVSTVNSFERGWETIVFEANESGEVLNWGELYQDLYDDKEEAKAGHKKTVDMIAELW